MTDRALLQQALEALTRIWEDGLENYPVWAHEAAIDNLRERLAQPEQEPVAWVEYVPCCKDQTCPKCKAITPPQRKPLTDEEITRIGTERQGLHQVARAIEAAHGIKGEA